MRRLILAATDIELSWLSQRLKAQPIKPLLDFPACRAGDALLLISGPGMANAAGAAAAAIERFYPDRIFNIGICGCYTEDTALLGTAVIGAQALFADTGAEGAGFLSLEKMNLPLCSTAGRKIFTAIKLIDAPRPRRLRRARFLTVASASGSSARAKKIAARFPTCGSLALCEDMESAAVALMALRAKIPCTVVRGISNICGRRDRAAWKIAEAATAAQETLCAMLKL
jgi:futalosine hydrolase